MYLFFPEIVAKIILIIRPHRPYYVRKCGLLLLTE